MKFNNIFLTRWAAFQPVKRASRFEKTQAVCALIGLAIFFAVLLII